MPIGRARTAIPRTLLKQDGKEKGEAINEAFRDTAWQMR